MAKENNNLYSWKQQVIWFVVSTAIGALLASAGNKPDEFIFQTFLFAVLFWLAQETFFSRREQYRMELEVTGLRKKVLAISSSLKTKNTVFESSFKSLSHDDIVLRKVSSDMMTEFHKNHVVEGGRLTLRGEGVSEDLYGHFWDVLIEEQKARPKGEKIKVRVSHSASLDVWNKDGLLFKKQKAFTSNGGEIYRILIRNSASTDAIERYDEVKREMDSIENMNAHVLDVSGRRKSSPPLIHDYLLVHLRDSAYVFKWIVEKGRHSEFGRINGSILCVNIKDYEESCQDWSALLDEVRKDEGRKQADRAAPERPESNDWRAWEISA